MAAAAAAAKTTARVVKVEGEEDVGGGGFKAGDECYNEGQIVWVRGGMESTWRLGGRESVLLCDVEGRGG